MTNADKKKIRESIRSARRSLPRNLRDEYSQRICNSLTNIECIKSAQIIMSYSAMPDEVNLAPLHNDLVSEGKRLCFPFCVKNGIMTALFPEYGVWKKNSMGIDEPDPEHSRLILPEEIDLVLIPCLAFDSSRARLGQGGGYYDRFLPKAFNAVKIGVAFEVQHIANVPIVPGQDIYPELIVTENAIYSR